MKKALPCDRADSHRHCDITFIVIFISRGKVRLHPRPLVGED
jgi:hypothetical protein